MTQANLYLQMWRATKDPKYIRLFREAVTQEFSKRKWAKTPYEMLRDSHVIPPAEEAEEELSRRVEKVGELGERELPALMTVWGIPPTEKQRLPDGKTWTEQELLAELKEQ